MTRAEEWLNYLQEKEADKMLASKDDYKFSATDILTGDKNYFETYYEAANVLSLLTGESALKVLYQLEEKMPLIGGYEIRYR